MHSRFIAMLLATFGLAVAVSASADVTTDRSASILVFPKIIADGTRDTLIQITNTSNSLVHAHCFYVNASLTDPSQPEGPLNPRLWQEIDFTIALTRQQPTYWNAEDGRPVNPTEPPCSREVMMVGDCEYAGFDPGLIPPLVPDFVGELKCVQVDDSGAPYNGNSLIGKGSIFGFGRLESGSLLRGESAYNAIGILGIENNGDGTLVLGGGQCVGQGPENGDICSSDEDCGASPPCAPEYNACPATWILNHVADGTPDLVLQEGIGDAETPIETELTIVPCTQNFETQKPTTVTLQFQTWNEFESQFSTSTSITCWGNFRLSDIGAPALTFEGQLPDKAGTVYLQTRLRSADATPYGVLMIAEEFHTAKPSHLVIEPDDEVDFQITTAAASNLHVEGERPVPDIITIPEEQLAP